MQQQPQQQQQSQMAGQLETLLDATTAFDDQKISLLEQAVNALYYGNQSEKNAVHGILTQLMQHPDAWRIVQILLVRSSDENTKFYALRILDHAVAVRWNVIPLAERQALPQYILELSLTAARSPSCSVAIKSKIREVLIKVIKHIWPREWPSFVLDLCKSAEQDPTVCQNNMQILLLLSEDILDFGEQEITSRRHKLLKKLLESQYLEIFRLTQMVLGNYVGKIGAVSLGPGDSELIETALKLLAQACKWCDSDFIYENDTALSVIMTFWDPIDFRGLCADFLAAFFSNRSGPTTAKGVQNLLQTWAALIDKCEALPPQSLEYNSKVPSNMRNYWENLYQQLAIAITGLASRNLPIFLFRQQDQDETLRLSSRTLRYIAVLTGLKTEETFKICVEFWLWFTRLLVTNPQWTNHPIQSMSQITLDQVRKSVVHRMAKPPQIYVVYDEDTQTVDRGHYAEDDTEALFYQLKELFINLAKLNPQNTINLLKCILNQFQESIQRDRGDHNWDVQLLNRLCWCVGALAGVLPADMERGFFILVLKSLLNFCAVKREKTNKALIAALIMYLNGEYPQFLVANDSLLPAIIEKIFEFMLDTFPGVQDMAAESFYKVCSGCAAKIALLPDRANPTVPYAQSIIEKVHQAAPVLTRKQRIIVYHAAAIIIGAAPISNQKILLDGLLAPLHQAFAMAVRSAQAGNLDLPTARIITEYFQINCKIAHAAGVSYGDHFAKTFTDVLTLYEMYGTQLGQLQTAVELNHSLPKEMRTTTGSILQWISTFITDIAVHDAQSRQVATQQILPYVLASVLVNYNNQIQPELRDPQVLYLAKSILSNFMQELTFANICEVITLLFLPTLEMVNKDLDSYMELRQAVFVLANSLVQDARFIEPLMPGIQAAAAGNNYIDQVLKCLLFAVEHEKPDLFGYGLKGVLMLLKNIRESNLKGQVEFAETYFGTIVQRIIGVLTDTLHQSGLNDQAEVIRELMLWAQNLNIPEKRLTPQMIVEDLSQLLVRAFPNLTQQQTDVFAMSVYANRGKPMKEFLPPVKDLTLRIKEFAELDAPEIEEERQAIMAAIA